MIMRRFSLQSWWARRRCVAMSQATDLMLDLKTGYLVGASPRMQQIGQFLGAWLGPIVIMILIFILHGAYGLGSERLPAAAGTSAGQCHSGHPRRRCTPPKIHRGRRHRRGLKQHRHRWIGNFSRAGILPALQYCSDIQHRNPPQNRVRKTIRPAILRRRRHPRRRRFNRR